MLKSYLKVAWRNIQRNRLYSFVNITGLTIGLASCILIGLFIQHELSYDGFHNHADRIARITMEYNRGGKVNLTAMTGTKAGPQLKRVFPQIEAFTRTMKYPRTVGNGIKVFSESEVLYADQDFFNIFSFRLDRGDANKVLSLPYQVVLTRDAARKYFGDSDPVGRTLRINGVQDYTVTGIAANPPENSQIRFEVILSFTSLGAAQKEEWFSANYVTYLLLAKGQRIAGLEKQVQAYMRQVGREELHDEGSDYLTYHLEPLRQVHLGSSLDGFEPNGHMKAIYILGIIAALILLIACVNYTNLATAQSAGRGTEIGVRKVLGAGRMQLLKQFLGESFLLSFFSLVLALAVSLLLLPVFNSITGKHFTWISFLQQAMLGSVLLLGLLIGLVSGAYPAFVLSNAGLIGVLKSGIRVSSSGGGLRKSLIVFQFVISVFLVVATIIIKSQLSFIQNRELGYEREQVLVLPADSKTRAVYEPLKTAMSLEAGVVSVTGAYDTPVFVAWGDGISAETGHGKKEMSVNAMPVCLDFIKTMDMRLLAGRDFMAADYSRQDTANDYKNYQNTYILNERAVKELGWKPETAIGKTIRKNVPGIVVGVVKDFHFTSMHEEIGPMVLFLDSSQVRDIFVRIRSDHIAETLAGLERTWKERIAHRPFEYHFLSEDFNRLYETEHRTADMFFLFAGLAIGLACLGLFALAAFTTVQRTREIGIRKILGARVSDITLMITKQFVMLVIAGILIACPLAWWAGSRWLQDFAYRIDISWQVFMVAAVMAILIAVLTVSYHAIKAAISNPVNSLRNE